MRGRDWNTEADRIEKEQGSPWDAGDCTREERCRRPSMQDTGNTPGGSRGAMRGCGQEAGRAGVSRGYSKVRRFPLRL